MKTAEKRKRAGRSRLGMTLLEIVIAFMVLALAIVGTMSLIVVVASHNEARAESNMAYKACQDILERLLSMDYATMSLQNGVTFAVTKINATQNIGTITITNVNPANLGDANAGNDTTGAGAGNMCLVEVRVQTTTVGRKPINVSISTWRANK
jgi:Tfp pilus assembly protein PilV